MRRTSIHPDASNLVATDGTVCALSPDRAAVASQGVDAAAPDHLAILIEHVSDDSESGSSPCAT
jgi:hypothetical protein